jgi:hypothetical protein
MSGMRSMTDDVGQRVAAKLAELQGSRTDAEMGALLGVGRVYWWQVKNGHRRLSYARVKRAAAQFPEILGIVVHDLSAPTEKAS